MRMGVDTTVLLANHNRIFWLRPRRYHQNIPENEVRLAWRYRYKTKSDKMTLRNRMLKRYILNAWHKDCILIVDIWRSANSLHQGVTMILILIWITRFVQENRVRFHCTVRRWRLDLHLQSAVLIFRFKIHLFSSIVCNVSVDIS